MSAGLAGRGRQEHHSAGMNQGLAQTVELRMVSAGPAVQGKSKSKSKSRGAAISQFLGFLGIMGHIDKCPSFLVILYVCVHVVMLTIRHESHPESSDLKSII